MQFNLFENNDTGFIIKSDNYSICLLHRGPLGTVAVYLFSFLPVLGTFLIALTRHLTYILSNLRKQELFWLTVEGVTVHDHRENMVVRP